MAASKTALSSISPGRVGFLDQAVDGWAVSAFRLLTELGEDLVETLDLVLRIDHVRLKSGLQVGIRRHLRHFRNGFRKLLLGVVDVLQLMQEQAFHRFDVFGEDTHRHSPL